ncbi:MAG: TonB-dependent receptor [Syntrophomonas sp.]
MYNNELIDLSKKMDIDVQNKTIDEILATLLEKTGIAYKIYDRQIVLSPSSQANVTFSLQQQAFKISGKVTDASGEALPGVSVVIKGTSTGVITDAQGSYSLPNVPYDAILVFSFVGMKSQEVAVAGKKTMNVTMEEGTFGIEEVVAIGYGTQKKASLTAAITSINSNEISKIPSSNLSNVLQGRLSGVYVQSGTGVPGVSSDIRVRFPSSFNSQPAIYVINNVVRDANAFNALDANEVESITALKDAAAAAIYGSRSSGGVILVTTKTGKIGKPVINLNTSVSTERLGPTRAFLSVGESLDLWNMILPGSVDADEKAYVEKMNPDGLAWFHAFYKKPWNVKGDMSVSGGNDIVTYYIGGSLYKEEGFMPQVNYKKVNLRGTVDVKITKDLTVGLDLATINENRNKMGFVGDADLSLYGMWAAMRGGILINVPPYIDGKPVYGGWVGNVPEIMKNGGYTHNPTDRTDVSLHLDYKVPFIKGLTAKLNYSNNIVNSYSKQYFKSTTAYQFKTTGTHSYIYTNEIVTPVVSSPPGATPGINSSNTRQKSYQLNGQLNYERVFGNHHIDAMLMYEQYEYYSWNVWSQRNNFPLYPIDQYFATSSNSSDKNGSGGEDLDSRLSYAGRINYNFKDKYLLSASFREDGSLKFSPAKRWGFFPSLSVGWVVSSEDFFKSATRFVNFLKVRGSVGTTGNDNIGGWGWLEQYAISGGYYSGGKFNTGLSYGGISNPNLTWETSRTFDGGLDMQLLNHLSLNVDYYYRHTFDILGSRILAVPGEFGASMPKENYGVVNAHGFEIEIGYGNKIGSDFSYHVKANFAYSTNKVKKWDVANGTLPVDDPLGKTMSYQTGYKALGILRTQEDLDKLPAGYLIEGSTPELGMMNFADINGPNRDGKPDGRIDSYDRIVVSKYNGVQNAPYTYGLLVNLGWKRFSLDAQFAGEGGYTIDRAQYWWSGMRSTPIYFKNSWTPENPTKSTFPKIFADAQPQSTSFAATSTFSLQDASFVRLKNINLGYTLPTMLIKKVGINSCQLYVQATNLLLLSKYKDGDPETYGVGSYPLMKTFMLGLNVKF